MFAGRTYMVSDVALDQTAVEEATLVLGTFTKSSAEAHRIKGLDDTVAFAVRNIRADSPESWRLVIDTGRLSDGWPKWFACSRGLVAGTQATCGAPPKV